MDPNNYEEEFYNSVVFKCMDRGDTCEDACKAAAAALIARRAAFAGKPTSVAQ